MKTTVLLADDHSVVRSGIKSLLTHELNLEVVGEASDGKQAIVLARELQPDIIIMDINMPVVNGIEAARQICFEQCTTKVIILSMYSDERYILEVLSLGASAYVLKECAFTELVQAIDKVLRNRTYISPEIGVEIIKSCLDRLGMKSSECFSPLTSRERQVLKLLADGSHNKDIAECLNMSVKTVEGHREHIIEKLGIHSIAELTKYAIRSGITSLEN